jgi:rod shape-determining protein MreD
MRKSVFAAVLLALAIVVQLTVLNGLRLPGSGVPDLVLVLVASLAMSDGPMRGMITGFAAGLCLDLAPPGSALLGEYALVFCLVGWAAGRLSPLVTRSALLSVAAVASVVAAGEAAVACLTLGLDSTQLSLGDAARVLPSSVAYDLLILPFALWLAVRAPARAQRLAARRDRSGVVTAAAGGGQAGRQHQPRQPRLAGSQSRPHDGWVGSKPDGLGGRRAPQRRPATPHRLRPANGVAGSAVTGPIRRPVPATASANLRLSTRRRRDGALGNAVGSSLGRHPGRHPGLRTTSSRFRPHAGALGGSAALQSAALLAPSWRRPVTVSFGSRRGDASVGRLLGTSLSSLVPGRSRRIATPRFRRHSAGVTPGLGTRLNTGRAADQQAILAARRRSAGTPRLRLASGRRGDGLVGGSALGGAGRGLQRSVRPASPRFQSRPMTGGGRAGTSWTGSGPAGKRPRFRYGRHPVLAFFAGRRGSQWLHGSRTGTRSGIAFLGRRTGG